MIQKRSWGYNEVLSLVLLVLSSYSLSSDDFNGSSKEILEAAYTMAPKGVVRVVRTLNGDLDDGGYPFDYVFLLGRSGVSKTTLAEAIAYKTGSVLKEKSSTEFVSSGRNSTTDKLNKFLESLSTIDSKTVVFIDEVDGLWENYDDSHYDTDVSSRALWKFLETGLKENKNLFFIGATNDVSGLPPQLRTRLEAAIIEVEIEPDGKGAYKALMDNFNFSGMSVSEEAREYLYEHKDDYASLTPRDIIHCAEAICAQAYDIDSTVISIEVEHIKAAAAHMEHMKELFNESSHETDQQQRERHHREAMYMQSTELHRRTRQETAATCMLIGGGIASLACEIL